MSNINDLYDVLFATLNDLRDPEKKIDTGRVKLTNDTAKNIIDAAKLEVDCMRITKTAGSCFLPAPAKPDQPTTGGQPTLVPAPPSPQGVGGQLIAANVTRHTID